MILFDATAANATSACLQHKYTHESKAISADLIFSNKKLQQIHTSNTNKQKS